MDNYSDRILKNDLISLGQELYKYVVGMEGNISARYNDGFIIKASGERVYDLYYDSFVTCDKNGNQLDNFDYRSSIETDFHSLLYSYPNVKFIAHTHPQNTLAILCGGEVFIDLFAKKRLYPEQVIFNGAISCVVNYETPGKKLSNQIKIYVEEYINKNNTFPKLILLKNHGIIACGESWKECLAITETCEKAAFVYLNVLKHGSGRFLTDSSVAELLENEQEKYRMSLCK